MDIKRENQSNKKAFSLMELMVVIVILGLLAAFILPNLTGKSEDAKRKITCIQMKSIGQALKLFKIDNGKYPSTEDGLQALISSSEDESSNFTKGGYLEGGKIPTDPWNNTYIYTSDDNVFDIISIGANKTEGGGDDIYFSKCK